MRMYTCILDIENVYLYSDGIMNQRGLSILPLISESWGGRNDAFVMPRWTKLKNANNLLGFQLIHQFNKLH